VGTPASHTLERAELTHSAVELLHRGEFDRLADLMREAEAIRSSQGDVSAQMLGAARQISEACLESKAELAWHEEALARLSRRERELREKLEEIIRLFGDQGASSSEISAASRDPAVENIRGRTQVESPGISVHCLGPFQVYFEDELVEDWPNGKGKAIFKYLLRVAIVQQEKRS
jgi:hypothetical protein